MHASDDLVHTHIREISSLQTIQERQGREIVAMSKAVNTLSDQFKQVKYAVFGAVAFYVLQSFGLLEVLKGLF